MSKMRFKERARLQVTLLRAYLSAGGLRLEMSEAAERCIKRIEAAARRGDESGMKKEVNVFARMFLKR